MSRDVTRQIVVAIATVAVIVVNVLANALPLNGLTTGEISDQFQVYFVPAGYVFSIWGLIYLGLIAYTVYQALPAQREDPFLRRIGYLYVLSCAANIAWLFLWHYLVFPLTVVAMSALLGLLIAIYLGLESGRRPVSASERWLVSTPFSIYLGWITVATIANVTSLLDYWGWNGWGISPEAWTVIMLVAATGIGIAMSVTRGDVAFAAVVVWALVGIAVKHAGVPSIATTAWIGATVVALAMLVGVSLTLRRMQQSNL